jgi:hypothetical protein
VVLLGTLLGVVAGMLAGMLAFGCNAHVDAKVERASQQEGFNRAEVKDMVFEWRVEKDSLRVRVTAPTTGWIAVGFEPGAYMKGADLIVARVVDGKAEARDDYADGMFSHAPDEKLGGTDDVTVVTGTEEGNKTIVELTIPLDSGDKYDKVLHPGKKTAVMLAYGSTDRFNEQHKKKYLTDIRL